MHPSDAVQLLFGNATDLYRVTPAEVKSAFRRRIRMIHPDAAKAALQHSGAAVSSLVSARDILIKHLQSKQPRPARPAFNQSSPASARTGVRPTVVRTVKPEPKKVPKKEHERYYRGVFPTYKLKLGQFLYFAGEISWQDLVRAMRWQRDQRPAYGEIAKAWGWLNDRDIAAVRAATDLPGMFGERAVALGLLSAKQAAFLVRHQHHCQPRLGDYFVRERLLLSQELNRLLAALNRHNASVERGDGPVNPNPFKPSGLVDTAR